MQIPFPFRIHERVPHMFRTIVLCSLRTFAPIIRWLVLFIYIRIYIYNMSPFTHYIDVIVYHLFQYIFMHLSTKFDSVLLKVVR